jgi:hypothetical protein
MSENSKNKPIHRLGPVWTGTARLEVAVWQSEDRRLSLSFSRSYKVDDEWKRTQTLFPQDALPLSRLLAQAWDWIQEQDKKGRDDAA